MSYRARCGPDCICEECYEERCGHYSEDVDE